MINKKLRSVYLSMIGAGAGVLAGCAHDPIIIDIGTKVPLIEANSIEQQHGLTAELKHKRSVSLVESQQRHLEKKLRQQRDVDNTMLRLSLEVELLTLENERIRQKTAYYSQYRANRKIKPISTRPQLQERVADKVITKLNTIEMTKASTSQGLSSEYLALQKSVALKKTEINQSLEMLSSQSLKYQQSSYQSKSVAVVTHQVSKSVTQKPKEKVLFHVVYVLSEKNAWQDLWVRLERNNVADKWRGRNKSKGVYFIYVGAYASEHYALRRQTSINERLGEAPLVISARKNVTLASLLSFVKG